MGSRNAKILASLVVACVVAGGAYIAIAALGPSQTTTNARPVAKRVLAHSDLMVRAVDPHNPRLNGHVYVIEDGKVEDEGGSDLACERVYYADGHGICMAIASSGVDYNATIFDPMLRSQHTIRLARISEDGRYGAMTVFVTGDSYLSSSTAFSTRTLIVDMNSGEVLTQLEQFHVTKDGKPFDAVDFNFWGVTFDPTDSNRFYATLGTGGHHYLVEGNIAARSMRVLRDGVECPSLSPNGKRIAFKSRIGSQTRWRLRVLDLATLADHPLAEKRSIDDQVEWLDDDTLAYSDERNVYTVPADGSGEPELLVKDATSPARLTAGNLPQ
jgi:hypothetical protein